jgi:hypothetical protein
MITIVVIRKFAYDNESGDDGGGCACGCGDGDGADSAPVFNRTHGTL